MTLNVARQTGAVLLSMLFVFAPTASADDGCAECNQGSASSGPGDGNETSSPPGHPSDAGEDPACRLIELRYDTDPTVWLILNMVAFDPDDCYNIFRDGAYMATYYPVAP